MELPSGVLLVCAILDIVLFASVFSAQHWSKDLIYLEGGIPLVKYEYCDSHQADNAVKCFESMCGSQSRKCTTAYNQKTKECVFMRLNSQLIFFGRERLIEEGLEDLSWRTIYMRVKALNGLPEPIGLWHFGHITQGMNLGSAGAMLDVRMTKDFLGQYYSWKHKFLKNSTLERFLYLYDTKANLYARFNRHRPEQIHFSHGVTFGAWILMNLRNLTFPWQDLITIKVEGVGNANLTFRIVYDTIRYDYHLIRFHRLAVLYRNASGVPIQLDSQALQLEGMKWRHFAVSVDKTGIAYFFLNGEMWSLSRGSLFGRAVPNKIKFLPAHNVEILAGMACAAIFDSALDPTQVKTLMELCP